MIRHALLLPVAVLGLQDARELVERLRSGDVEERADAAKRLRGMGDAALPDLEKAEKDADREVASRAREVARWIRHRPLLSPRLVLEFPGADERLARGDDHEWTALFVKAGEEEGGERRHPGIKRDDVEPLVALAARNARTLEEKWAVCGIVVKRRLKSGADEIRPWLQDTDAELRQLAVTALGRMKAKGAAGEVARRLEDIDPVVRTFAIRALVDLGATDAAGAVAKRLADREPGVREAAADAIAAFGAKEHAGAIEALLVEPHPSVRRTAVEALDALGARESVAKMLDDPDAIVRATAASASRDPARLQRMLSDPSEDVQWAATQRLGGLRATEAGPALAKLVDSPHVQVARAAVDALAALRSKAAEAILLERVRNGTSLGRVLAATALGRMGARETAGDLVGIVRDGPAGSRVAAITALGLLGAVEAREPLRQALAREEADGRMAAAEALGRIGGREATDALAELLSDPSPSLRGEAAEGLGAHEARDRAAALEKLLRADGDAGVRVKAMEALSAMGHRESLSIILERLRDRDAATRRAALRAAGRLGSGDTIAAIRPFLSDRDALIRAEAAHALCRLGSDEGVPEALEVLECGPGIRHGALNALRTPERWRALADERIAVAGGATVDELRSAIGARVEGAVRAVPLIPRTGRLTRLEALELIVEPWHEVVVEQDRVRILTREEAVAFWAAWWRDRRK